MLKTVLVFCGLAFGCAEHAVAASATICLNDAVFTLAPGERATSLTDIDVEHSVIVAANGRKAHVVWGNLLSFGPKLIMGPKLLERPDYTVLHYRIGNERGYIVSPARVVKGERVSYFAADATYFTGSMFKGNATDQRFFARLSYAQSAKRCPRY